MVGSCKCVEILMATYNGAQYVGRQIDSIINQKGVDVHITIRDDGSKDNTPEVLHSYEKLYPSQIKVILGENIGHRRCFLTLLSLATKADYYAFSDQDDIWEEEKLHKQEAILKPLKEHSAHQWSWLLRLQSEKPFF